VTLDTDFAARVTPAVETVLHLRTADVNLGPLPDGLTAALRDLAAGDVDELELTAAVLAADGPAGVLRLQLLLRRLDAAGQVERAVRAGGRTLARLRPVGRGRVPRTTALPPSQPVKLSRFAVIRASDGHLVAQAPRSHMVVELSPEAGWVLGALARWTTPAEASTVEVSAVGPGLPAGTAKAILPLLADAGLLAPGGPEADTETDAPALAQWTVPDLWLHSRSRGPLLNATYGGAYLMASRFPPLPARAEPDDTGPDAGPGFELAVPGDVQDLPLSEALERRRSTREHDDSAPLTAGQLGELLYRTTRLRSTFVTAHGQEAADRPYPSGGAAHELEIYPLVTKCDGLEPGLWHYRADEHRLQLVAKPGPVLARMTATSRAACVMTSDPQVVLVIAARFGRVMWKYDAVAYSLVLKHVGVYMQTVYLVATAMGLAVCGVGGGDATDFATATGLDYYAQGSVGEMVLGSRPAVPGNGIRLPSAPGDRTD
jgi:SagB-type dehydrogenase family enzyme